MQRMFVLGCVFSSCSELNLLNLLFIASKTKKFLFLSEKQEEEKEESRQDDQDAGTEERHNTIHELKTIKMSHMVNRKKIHTKEKTKKATNKNKSESINSLHQDRSKAKKKFALYFSEHQHNKLYSVEEKLHRRN